MIKKIDRLILKEIAGPWTFGVGLFTSLLMAGTYLGRLTGFIAGGADSSLVGRLVLLYLPALLVKTFSMSMLLAGLLGFGRLSSDSEIVALKASGASVPRIVAPVAMASFFVALVTFWFNDAVVPRAASEAIQIADRLAREGKVGGRGDAKAFFKDGKLVASITAQKLDLMNGSLSGVVVNVFDEKQNPTMVLIAPTVTYKGFDDWQVGPGSKLIPILHPRAVIQLDGGSWPAGVPKPKGALQSLFAKDNEYDMYTIAEIKAKIKEMRQSGDREEKQIRDFEYGYWNKYSVAFAAVVFGTLGAVLGIRNHRTGTAAGFALAVGIIFGYITLANFMNVWAQSGLLPPYAASFAPLVIGLVSCIIIVIRRNV